MRILLLAALMIPAVAGSVWAQHTAGALHGQITDDTGGVIPNAVVTLSGAGGQRSAQTQGDGSFSFERIPPGNYKVRAAFPGFSPFEADVTVSAGHTAQLSVRLKLSADRQEVTVQADAGPVISVEPDSNASALVLKDEDLQALPDNPEDLQDALSALAGPGAGPGGGTIYVDGFSGGTLPPKESIREIRVNQNPFSAEYDRLGYGRIEILTRPGSDRFRGSVFYSGSEGALNSRNPFSANKPDFSFRRYGVNLGGPLGRKASFALDLNRRQTDDNAVVFAPNFVDPSTLAVTPVQRSVVTPSSWWSVTPRIDYQLSKNHTLTARLDADFSRRENQGIGGFRLPSPYAALGYDSRGNDQDLMISETAVLSARMINETRFRFNRDFNESLGDNSIPTVNVAGAFTTGGNQTGNSYTKTRQFELQNNTSYAAGRHTVKWGIRARRFSRADYSPSGYGGSFSFLGGVGPVLDASYRPVLGEDGEPLTERLLAVDQYVRTLALGRMGYSPSEIRALGGGASRFTINAGNPYASVAQYDVAPWVQDDWRARSNLTLSLGLRFEGQTNTAGFRDFAPRVGIAWSPGAGGRGQQKTVIRAGFGMFYDRVAESLTLSARRLNGFNQLSYVVYNPDFFPNAPDISLLTPQQNSIQRIAADLRSPYNIQSAVSIERQLPRSTTVALTYTFTRGNRLRQLVPVNVPVPGTYPPGEPQLGVRPLGDIGNVFEYRSGGLMKQHMLTANFNSRFNRRISLFGNYTLNRTWDLPGQPSNPFDFRQDWGPSSMDRRHRFQLVGSVAAPLGIQFSPFLVLQSGAPYDVLLGTDVYGDTWENERPAFATPETPNAICRLPYGCFTAPVPGSAANLVPRNYLRTPGLVAFNARVARSFGFGAPRSASQGGMGGPGRGGPRGFGGMGMGGRRGGFGGFEGPSSEHRFNLTLSLMVQNVLNRVNPGGYEGNINSPQFGMPTTVNSGFGGGPGGGGAANNRRLEFQTRLTF